MSELVIFCNHSRWRCCEVLRIDKTWRTNNRTDVEWSKRVLCWRNVSRFATELLRSFKSVSAQFWPSRALKASKWKPYLHATIRMFASGMSPMSPHRFLHQSILPQATSWLTFEPRRWKWWSTGALNVNFFNRWRHGLLLLFLVKT